MAWAKMVEEPVFFDIMAEAETQTPDGELRTPGEQDPEPPSATRLQVVSSGGRLRAPPADLTLLFSWVTKTTPGFKTDVLCSCHLNLKLR